MIRIQEWGQFLFLFKTKFKSPVCHLLTSKSTVAVYDPENFLKKGRTKQEHKWTEVKEKVKCFQ